MNKYFVGLISIIIAVVGLSGVIGYQLKGQTEQKLGSVAQSSEYHATTTSYRAVPTGVVKTGSGVLGSVIITGAGAGMVEIYDATTTNSGLRAASMTTSSIYIASFPASTAAGTYTFDQVFYNGLIIITETVRPTSTITYR